jgi:hypothetical protein
MGDKSNMTRPVVTGQLKSHFEAFEAAVFLLCNALSDVVKLAQIHKQNSYAHFKGVCQIVGEIFTAYETRISKQLVVSSEESRMFIDIAELEADCAQNDNTDADKIPLLERVRGNTLPGRCPTKCVLPRLAWPVELVNQWIENENANEHAKAVIQELPRPGSDAE